MKKLNSWLIAGLLLLAGTVFQVIGTLRYWERIPEDIVGIGIYYVSTVLFGAVTFGFILNGLKKR